MGRPDFSSNLIPSKSTLPFDTSRISGVKAAWLDLRAHWRCTRPIPPLPTLFWLLFIVGIITLVPLNLYVDAPFIRWAETFSTPLVDVFQKITRAGQSDWLFALSIILIIIALRMGARPMARRLQMGWRVLASRAFFFLATMAFSGVLSQAPKHILSRARPKLLDSLGPHYFDFFAFKSVMASFPSGHATTAFAAATALSLMAPRWTPLFVALATPIAASRLIIAAHYPTDVVTGTVLGVVCVLVLARIFARRRIVFAAQTEATPNNMHWRWLLGVNLHLRGKGLIVESLRSGR